MPVPNETVYTPFNPEFLIIPYQVFTDKRLQQADALVYAICYWFERLKDGKCFASNKTIGDYLHLHPHSVARSLGRLEGCGYIALIYKDSTRRTRQEIRTLVTYNTTGFNPQVKGVSPAGYTRFNPQVNRISNTEYRISINKGKIKKSFKREEDTVYDLDQRTNSMDSLKETLKGKGIIK
jgi:hypothetical protein